MDKNDLYNGIDKLDITDAEKRELYISEKEQAQQEWMDENW
jgi:hypothetical protein